MVRRVGLAVIALALGLGVAAEYAPYTFLYADHTFYANVNRSLTENVTFRQDGYTARSWYFDDLGWNRTLGQDWSNVALGVDGSLYPKHPVVLPLVAEPLFLLFGYDGLLLANLLLLLLAAAMTLARLDPAGDRPLAVVAAAAVFLSPVVVRYAYGYSNDVFSAAALAAGLLALAERPKGGVGPARALVGGVALGLLVWARPAHALWALVVAVPPLVRGLRAGARREAAALVLGLSGVLAVPAALHAAWFGSPFLTGYDRVLVRDAGVLALDSARAAFDWPGWADVGRVLVTDEQAFLAGMPLLALVPLGWVAQALRGRRGEAVASALVLVGTTLLYAGYAYASARFVMPLAFFVAAPVAALLEALGGGAGRVREVLGRRWPRASIVGLPVLGLALAVGIGAGVLRLAGPRPEAGPAEGLRVTTLEGRPCDFWNLKWQRWECSHLDRDEHDQVGAPRGAECGLPGDGWVRVPASGPFPGKALEVPPPPGARALEWQVAADPAARPRSGVPLTVAGAVATLRVEVVPQAAPVTRRATLRGGGTPVRFEIPAAEAGPRREAVCLRWEWR